MISYLEQNDAGLAGIEIVTDTVARTGDYSSIIALTDLTFTSLTPKVALPAASNAFTDITALPKGMEVKFEFTGVELATGQAILKRSVKTV